MTDLAGDWWTPLVLGELCVRIVADAIPKNAIARIDKVALRAAHALSNGSNT